MWIRLRLICLSINLDILGLCASLYFQIHFTLYTATLLSYKFIQITYYSSTEDYAVNASGSGIVLTPVTIIQT